MRIYDLSHPLNEQIPVYPGTASPSFTPSNTIEKEGFRETRLSFDSHTGTHIDAPAHMLEKGKTLDRFPVDHFTGKALIITIPWGLSIIGKDLLLQFEHKIASMDFVLLKTGWSMHWGKPEYFKGFPTLAHDATDHLLTFSLRGIGFDTISADTAESKDYPNHIRIFEKNLIIIENIVFPVALTESSGIFSCFPLPLENADGSPVRAVLSV